MKTHRPLVLAALVALGLACIPALPTRGSAQMAQTITNDGREVVVVVEGLRNDRGLVVGGLYDHAGTWLAENQAAENCHASIHHGRARCVFHATTREVAFAALHDEDSDGELDRDLIGIPTEGYAFSNDAREPFGPPSFDAASFSPVRTTPFVVHVRYGI
jgi:uncharacterized protein (DUF2141 family)